MGDGAEVGLQKAETPAPQAVLAIESRLPLKGELMSFYVDEGAGGNGGVAPGPGLFTEGSLATPIVREPTHSATGVGGATRGRSCVRTGAARG